MNAAAAEFILSELYPIFSNCAQRTNSIFFLQKMVAKMVTPKLISKLILNHVKTFSVTLKVEMPSYIMEKD